LIDRFGLEDHVGQRALDLPLGIRQRLSLAALSSTSPRC
jgi:ABC-type multidrug transport system ATPase subunit